MFHLIWPWLLLLLPLPLLKGMRPAQRYSSSSAPRMPLYERVQQLDLHGVKAPREKRVLEKILLFLAWSLLLFAAARPEWVGDKVSIPLSGRDLMLAVDISPSMQTKDMIQKGFQASRLQVVKSVVSDFIKHRKGDRVGLILFGTRPYIQAPLTFDTKTVNKLLDESQVGMAGQATAIGDAILLAVKRLRDRPEKSRVLILLTDGANNAGEIPPKKAVEFAKLEKVKIYTIGIGADRMIQQGFFGPRTINPSSDLDAHMLKMIAKQTGGEFFRAKNTAKLGMIYEAINRLEPVKHDSKTYRPTKDLYYIPLAASLILYFIALFQIPNLFISLFRRKTP
jgi:Ca-activated chloride channel family protein